MKITKNTLKQLIKEEFEAILLEDTEASWEAARGGDPAKRAKAFRSGIGPSDDPLRAEYNKQRAGQVNAIAADLWRLFSLTGPEGRLARPEIRKQMAKLGSFAAEKDPDPRTDF